MSNIFRTGCLAAALLVDLACYAASNEGDIEVSGAWTRATAPGQDQAGVDLTITSKQAAALVGISTPVSKSAALHSMTTDKDGMMRMREMKSVELPAGKAANLAESGYHVMLEGLKAPLKEGDTVPLTLSIKVGQVVVKIGTKAEVKSLTETAPHNDENMHMQMN